MATILVIDDDSGVCRAFSLFLGRDGHQAISASSAEEGLELAARERPALIFLDVRLPGMSGLDALVRLSDVVPGTPVVVMTGHGTLSTAVEAVRRGAFDYLAKPVGLEAARAVVARALAHSGRSAALEAARRELADFPPEALLVGRGPAMQGLYRQIAAAAAGDATVLLQGESGTGKELAARAIHLHSSRAGGPFVALNCAGLPETLLESELFGHTRGAFTGAVSSRLGRLESADGGTLLLDEVGEMSPAMQAKLLRFLESRCFERLGESQPRQVDVRIVSATNRDLGEMAAAGRFRQDLFYRLDVLHIELPALRERPEDIALLVAHFLAGPDGSAPRAEISPAALQLLERHSWPGNVRELRNCLEHAVALARGSGTVRPEHLPGHLADGAGGGPDDTAGLGAAIERLVRQLAARRLAAGGAGGDIFGEAVRLAERAALAEVLSRLGGNQVQAARQLGLHRTTLRNKIAEYGLGASRGPAAPAEENDSENENENEKADEGAPREE
jgi:DNA-binding NtrC family response regulator